MGKVRTRLLLLVFTLQLAVPRFLFATTEDTSICYLRDNDGRIREHNVDFINMDLTLKFDTRLKKVIGNVKYDFKPIQFVTDTLFLNAPEINISKVLLNGLPTLFAADSNGLTIRFAKSLDWNKQYKLEVVYEATPNRGLYFIGWDVAAFDKSKLNERFYTRQQIWTQGQGIDNRHWIPCYDDVNDKMLVQTTITFDSAYTVISNGELKSKAINKDGTATWKYAMNKPMVPYLIMLAIDKYDYKDFRSKNGMVSRQYYYRGFPETVAPTYAYSAEMMDWLVSELEVPYPWKVYSNTPVQDFMYGAMENTTATIFGDFSLCDARMYLDRWYLGTNAHELTHQWFGDYITEYSGTHHWLHESFATYYAKQFVRKALGEDKYEWEKRNEQNQAISADKGNRFPVAHTHGGSSRHYPKGSAVIDMIRYVVGDSVYKKSVTAYLKKHAYANVVSDDFKRTFMETAGVNLDWFFDQWIYRAGFPRYEVTTERFSQRIGFYVAQVQDTDELTSYFKMPLVFEVHFTDGSKVADRFWLSRANDTVYLPIPVGKEIAFTLFDPASNVLKEVNFPKSYKELAAQAEYAPHIIDRYDALVALRDSVSTAKDNLLNKLFNANGFYALQDEILLQLSKTTNNAFASIIKQALQSKDAAIRKSAIENIIELPDDVLPVAEKILADSSYINIENMLRKLCLNFPDKKQQYLELTKDIVGLNYNVRVLWLELQCQDLDKTALADNVFIKQLAELASNRYEFRTRVRAFEALERIGYCDEAVVNYLLNAAVYTNGRLANPAAKCLRSFIRKGNYEQMIMGIYSLGAWSEHDRRIIDAIFARK